MARYEWKRFWYPHDESYSLAEDGYLYDPDGEYGRQLNPELAKLENFAAIPCLVLLGEPGTGKSTEFELETSRAVEEAKANSDSILSIDLKEYQTDGRLVADAFDNETVREWTHGTHALHLFFDSLDEGGIEIKNIASILGGQLRKLAPYAHRLRLRIACRTAEWPMSLESTLKNVWNEQSVGVIELAPLRRVDIAAAAQSEGIEPAQFLNDVSTKRVQPFAATPITLRFLLKIHRQAGELPASRYELYEQGCLHLCDEMSQSRRDAGHTGSLTARQRLEVASRIAACTVFCGRTVIERDTVVIANDGAINISDLAGDCEAVGTDRFTLTEDAVREGLSTALFSGRGTRSCIFSHRTYAEFLAGRYVNRRQLDEVQLASLLFHPEDTGKVIPQLSETAAWVAAKRQPIFERMMLGDAQCLLRSDVATADDGIKLRLTQVLLNGFQAGYLDDSDWSLRDHYRKLSHSALGGQLAPLISDPCQGFVARRFAIQVAAECQVKDLLDTLLSVTLNPADDPEIRSEACRSVVAIGDTDSLQHLKPLALGTAGADPRDELRGIALRALWPCRLLNARELFASLSRPALRSFIGAYRHFISRELPSSFRWDDLPEGLRWCSSLTRSTCPSDELADVASIVLEQSVANMHREEVRSAFIEFAVSRLMKQETLGISTGSFAEVPDDERRAIVQNIVLRLDDVSKSVFGLTIARPILIREGDLKWLLEKACLAPSEKEKYAWAVLARARFVQNGVKDVDYVLELCHSHPVIETEFDVLFRPVELASEEASRLRKQYERMREMESITDDDECAPLLDPSPALQVADSLKRCEEGDFTAWCDLNRALQLEPRSTHYEHDDNDDLTTFPGWGAADDATQRRIILCAQRYLCEWTPRAHRLTGSREIYQADLDGYRALTLIERFDSSLLESFEASRWLVFVPVIFVFPIACGIGDAAEKTQERLISMAYRKAREAVRNTVLNIIEEENAEAKSKYLFVLRRIESCLDEYMMEAILNKAKEGVLTPGCLGDLLGVLIAHKNRSAFDFGISLVGRRSDELSNAVAVQAAAVTWRHSPNDCWDIVWPEFRADVQFFRSVMLALTTTGGPVWQGPAKLLEERLADLFILLSQEFPTREDPDHDGAHFASSRDSVKEYRDGVLAILKNRGTLDACSEIDRIVVAFPDLEYLKWIARSARRLMLQSTWKPLPIAHFLELARRPATRLVRSARDLQKVILESISRLQSRLQGETPAARDLWDNWGDEWKPVDENAFSDYVKRHFDSDLAQSGIVALREVEIRRGYHSTGERTDFYVAATVYGYEPGSVEVRRLIVEAKGCWNADLKTSMQTQLKDRYLKENSCEHGIYLVGWFPRDRWTKFDGRRATARAWTLYDASDFFKKQAEELTSADCVLEGVVVDVSLS